MKDFTFGFRFGRGASGFWWIPAILAACLPCLKAERGEASKSSPKLAAYLVKRADPLKFADLSAESARLEALKPAIFSSEDLVSARTKIERTWLITSGVHTRSTVILRFTPEAAARIRDRLEYELGECLIVVVEGKVISQQMIGEPLSGEEFTVDGGFSPDEAKRFTKTIKATLR